MFILVCSIWEVILIHEVNYLNSYNVTLEIYFLIVHNVGMHEEQTNSGVNLTHLVQDSEINFPKIIENMLAILLGLLPFFVLPFTVDLLTINKTFLVVIFALAILLLYFGWGLKMKKLQVLSFYAYVPMLLLLIAGIISAIFSQNVWASFLGSNGKYDQSVIFLLALAIIGFVASNVKLNIFKIARFFVVGVVITTLVSFLIAYGVNLPVLGLVQGGFSLAGPSYTLAGLQVVAFLISLFVIFSNANEKPLIDKIIHIISLLVLFTYLINTINLVVISIVIVTIVYAYFFAGVRVSKDSKKAFMPLFLVMVLVAFLSFFSVTKSFLRIPTFVETPRLPITESWLISAETVRDLPLRGSGLGTFANDFTLYRPASLNNVPSWTSTFDMPFNGFFYWLAVGGLVGFLLYCAFWVLVLRSSKNLSKTGSTSLFASIFLMVAFLVSLLFGYNLVMLVFLFVLIGIANQYSKHSVLSISSENATTILGVFTVMALVLAVAFGIQGFKVYAGQVYYRQSLLNDTLGGRYLLQRKAIASDIREGTYRREVIFTDLAIAKTISEVKDITQDDTTQFQASTSEAINEARVLSELLDPQNAEYKRLRGLVFDSLTDVAGADTDKENFRKQAEAGYLDAINLEPTNPTRWVDIAGLYSRHKNYQNAVSAYARAIQLKPDYINARYGIALVLYEAKYYVDAATQMEVVSRLLPKDSPDADAISKLLAEYKVKSEEAQKAALEAQQQQAAAANVPLDATQDENLQPVQNPQEPLTTPEEQGQYNVETDNPELSVPAPAADGTPTQEGQTEAPLSKPAE